MSSVVIELKQDEVEKAIRLWIEQEWPKLDIGKVVLKSTPVYGGDMREEFVTGYNVTASAEVKK